MQCVVNGSVTVENVSPDGVPCVMNEWDCNCFVNEKIALCWYVLRCPVFGVQCVGEEKQCSLDADFGFYVNDMCPCVDETDVVSRVDDVGVVRSGRRADRDVRKKRDEFVSFVDCEFHGLTVLMFGETDRGH